MCSFASQAGLFSAVASAFILDVQSQLQPDTGEETAALLRVLINKIDNTTFGCDTPALPQWTGPSHGIVQVQAILYASLAASLLSAFLAMLGKQWLNQYAWTDMRGSAVERSQNRQRKLDGITAWYFNYMMEALPLMLQIALLLLSCVLSRYLWEINIVVAFVVLGVTSFGVAFYAFIVVAGTASESCPYQTPCARILRHTLRSIPPNILSIVASSWCCQVPVEWWSAFERPWYSMNNILLLPLLLPLRTLIAAAVDAYHLGRAIHRSLVAFGRMAYRWVASPFHRARTSDQQTIALGLRCISWILQTSLDKSAHLLALEHLARTMALPELNPAIVADCFNVFVGCISSSGSRTAIKHGSEQLAIISALCFLHTLRRLSVVDPTSGVIEDVCQYYNRVFGTSLSSISFRDLNAVSKILSLFRWELGLLRPSNHAPSTQGQVQVTRYMAEAAQVEYQQTQRRKVPRWILLFALDSLSLNPLPPTSVVADCLSIIAIDLGCDVSDTGPTTLDERCVHFLQTTTALTSNQRTSRASFATDNSETQNEGRS